MFEQWWRHRAASRVKTGDGHPLQRFRWWQLFSRSLFHIRLADDDGPTVYAVDVRHWGDKDTGTVKAQLYRDGRHHAESKVPAVFPVEGGAIEVAVSAYGLKRCRYVTTDGRRRQLLPDPASAEGRRARLDREHPTASRWIGVVSVILLIAGVGLNLLQLIEPISGIPPIADNLGRLEAPIHLPLWLNIALGLGAALASAERALRLRFHWLLDAAAN